MNLVEKINAIKHWWWVFVVSLCIFATSCSQLFHVSIIITTWQDFSSLYRCNFEGNVYIKSSKKESDAEWCKVIYVQFEQDSRAESRSKAQNTEASYYYSLPTPPLLPLYKMICTRRFGLTNINKHNSHSICFNPV